MSERKNWLPSWLKYKVATLALLGLAHLCPIQTVQAEQSPPYTDLIIPDEVTAAEVASLIGIDGNSDGLPDVAISERVNEELAKIGITVLQVQQHKISELLKTFPHAEVDNNEIQGMDNNVSFPNDPELLKQWYITDTGVLDLIRRLNSGDIYAASANGTIPHDTPQVGILDSGIHSHPDVPDPVSVTEISTGTHNHALNMLSLIAAITNNGEGVASLLSTEADLHSYVVLGSDNSGSLASVAAGIISAAENGMQVLNLSLGGRGEIDSTRWRMIDDAMKYANQVNPNMIMIVSAGNFGDSTTCDSVVACHPGISNLIIVGNYKQDKQVHGLSNSVPGMQNLLIIAPGHQMIVASIIDQAEGYGYTGGTSGAAAFTSGLVAKLIELGISPEDIQNYMFQTAVDMGAEGLDPKTGHGRLDIPALIQALVDDGLLIEREKIFLPDLHKSSDNPPTIHHELLERWREMERRKAAKNQTSRSATISA